MRAQMVGRLVASGLPGAALRPPPDHAHLPRLRRARPHRSARREPRTPPPRSSAPSGGCTQRGSRSGAWSRRPLRRRRLPLDRGRQHLGVQLPPGDRLDPLVEPRLRPRDRRQPDREPVRQRRDHARTGRARRTSTARGTARGRPTMAASLVDAFRGVGWGWGGTWSGSGTGLPALLLRTGDRARRVLKGSPCRLGDAAPRRRRRAGRGRVRPGRRLPRRRRPRRPARGWGRTGRGSCSLSAERRAQPSCSWRRPLAGSRSPSTAGAQSTADTVALAAHAAESAPTRSR